MNDLNKAVSILRNGRVIIFPTDTVWGMGAAISDRKGIEKFYQIKGREENKPTAVLVADVDMANRYGVMSKEARNLAQKHWPGALTIIVKARGNKVSKLVRGGGETVGLRAPDHKVALETIKVLDEGIVTGSANFAGDKAPVKKAELNPELIKLVDFVVEGECGGQEPSTVVETGRPWRVVRQGAIQIEI